MDERCCHYSYHRSGPSHPDHNHCFLFTLNECDVNNLVYDGSSHWRTGERTLFSPMCHHWTQWGNFFMPGTSHQQTRETKVRAAAPAPVFTWVKSSKVKPSIARNLALFGKPFDKN